MTGPGRSAEEPGGVPDDHLRASDADRDRAAAMLHEHGAAGQLTAGKFGRRLEAGYRRLLALYPARYRRVQQEEILAMLMTAARPGQRRPGLADALDLVAGAVRVRCQPARQGEPSWRRVLAVAAAATLAGLLAGLAFAARNPPPHTSTELVVISSTGPSGGRAQATATSRAVLERAARRIGPALSEQSLQREVQVSLVTDRILRFSVRAFPARQALRAVKAIALSYLTEVYRHADPRQQAMVLDPATVIPWNLLVRGIGYHRRDRRLVRRPDRSDRRAGREPDAPPTATHLTRYARAKLKSPASAALVRGTRPRDYFTSHAEPSPNAPKLAPTADSVRPAIAFADLRAARRTSSSGRGRSAGRWRRPLPATCGKQRKPRPRCAASRAAAGRCQLRQRNRARHGHRQCRRTRQRRSSWP